MQQFTTSQQDSLYKILYNRLPDEIQMQNDKYIITISNRMVALIVADLTIGKTDKNQSAWKYERIKEQLSKIKKYPKAVMRMFKAYKKDNDLDNLLNGEDDYFREYLK